jgi:MFS family permease
MAPNLSAIAEDFGFDDVERDMKLGGQIPFAFFVVGGAISLVIGPMADWMDRSKLFVAVVLIGNIPCLLTYFVTISLFSGC